MIETIINNAWRELNLTSAHAESIPPLMEACRGELLKKKIIIYPTGSMGRTLGNTLREQGIPVEFYVDRAAADIGAVDGVPVRNLQALGALTEDHIALVSVNLDTMMRQLIGQVRHHNSSLTILNGFQVNRLLRHSLCLKKLNALESFDLIACEKCGFERHECSIAMQYLKRIAGTREIQNDWRSPALDWFGYIVGQVCTLKCIHCCEAIPYLKEHKFVHRDVIIRDVRKMAASSRFLTFVELIGGEPFMHPDFKSLIQELLEIKNIGYIKSFTNGTVVPDIELCQLLKNPRFMLQVSNYEKQTTGKLLENIHKTRAILKEQSVPYIFTQNFEWQDFTSFDLHHTDENKVKTVFNACMLRNCNRLYRGMLYRCPHQYAGVQLGILNRHPVECVDINQYEGLELAKALEAFESVQFINACRYCLMPFDAPNVPAGIQLHSKSK